MNNLSKDTLLCISISERPGNFGTKFFNAAFTKMKLDYLYKAMKLMPNCDLEAVLKGVRALGIRGISVSMPFKERVIPYLDRLEQQASRIGAVNTIVNNDALIGYNTDYLGIQKTLTDSFSVKNHPVLVCGSGGMAKAVVVALLDLGAEVYVTGRNEKKINHLANSTGSKPYLWEKLSKFNAFLFVNATSVGMYPNTDQSIVGEETLQGFEAVLDVVNQPQKTKLIQLAERLNKKTISGQLVAINQAFFQFELYTGEKLPENVFRQILYEVL